MKRRNNKKYTRARYGIHSLVKLLAIYSFQPYDGISGFLAESGASDSALMLTMCALQMFVLLLYYYYPLLTVTTAKQLYCIS